MLLLCSQAHQSTLYAFLDVTVRVRLHQRRAVTRAYGAELQLAASCSGSKISRASTEGLRHVCDEVVGREGFKLFPRAMTTQHAHRTDRRARVCTFEHFKSGRRGFLDDWIKHADVRFRFEKLFSDFQRGGFPHSSVFGSTRGQKAPPFSLSAYQASQVRAQRRGALWAVAQHSRRPADNLGLTSSPCDEEAHNLLTSRIISADMQLPGQVQ